MRYEPGHAQPQLTLQPAMKAVTHAESMSGELKTGQLASLKMQGQSCKAKQLLLKPVRTCRYGNFDHAGCRGRTTQGKIVSHLRI